MKVLDSSHERAMPAWVNSWISDRLSCMFVPPSGGMFVLQEIAPGETKNALRGRTLSGGQWICIDRNEEKMHCGGREVLGDIFRDKDAKVKR